MQFEITANGALRLFCVTNEDVEAVREYMANAPSGACIDDHVLANILEDEGWPGNDKLYQVAPEWIGALTNAPILSDDVRFMDDGTAEVLGRVWWFPQYQVVGLADQLLKAREVFLSPAPDSRASAAERAYENYNFGEGVEVVGRAGWDRSDPDDLILTVFVRYDTDPDDADSHKVSFHVRFEAEKVSEVYALECDHGQMIGSAE